MSADPIGNRKHFQHLMGGGYGYTLVDEAVRVEVRHLRREHHQLIGEVDVLCEWAGARTHNGNGSLSCADLNLSSQTARVTRGKYCAERAKTKPGDFDWPGVIDDACRLVIDAERQGDDVIVLDDAPELANRDLDIHGLKVPADASSMLIAHGDSLKSMLLLFVLGTVAQQGRPSLFVDWEWTADRHLARKKRLFGPERIEGLRYLHSREPLVIISDRIRRYCDTHRIEFLGIDSVGLACDGKLVDDDVAIRFHRALASLPPALCAAHVPKSSLGADVTSQQAFGSVYFTNLCRASWAVKKQPGATDDLVTVGLFPQKQNDGARRRPVGFEFTFSPERIAFRHVDLATVDGLAERLPLAVRITGLLKKEPLTFAAIAEKLEAKVNSVVQAVTRDKSFTKVTGADGVHRIALVEKAVRAG